MDQFGQMYNYKELVLNILESGIFKYKILYSIHYQCDTSLIKLRK